jgi:maltose alpha-D-glucosyltransferase/alpha-amylase
MAFNFPVMPYIFYALKSADATGLATTLNDLPPVPAGSAWGVFLRNHDELTLEMVSDVEKEQMYAWYAPEPRMKVNVGIRRRLAPLLDGRRDKLELANALLLSLPGSPFLYYGDEIAMGDNIWLDDRDASRTPMQWTSDVAAGFSNAPVDAFYLPVVNSTEYSPDRVNVENQVADPQSMLNWTREMLALRKTLGAVQIGTFRGLATGSPAVLAFVREPESPGNPILCVFNFAESAVSVSISGIAPAGSTIVDVRGGTAAGEISDSGLADLELPPMSWHWLQVS